MRELQVGGDGVGQLGDIVHAHGGGHGLVVERLAELDVLLKETGDALHGGFDLRRELGGVLDGADAWPRSSRRSRPTCRMLAALQAFDQNLDVAVRQLEALHDVDDGADLVNLVRLRLVDAGVVLGGEEDPLVAGQRLFQRAHAGLAAHDERRHHVRER